VPPPWYKGGGADRRGSARVRQQGGSKVIGIKVTAGYIHDSTLVKSETRG